MSAKAVADFVGQLQDYRLLDPAALDVLRHSRHMKESDPRWLIDDLLRRGQLTPFQVELLEKGRGRELRVGPYLLLDCLGEGSTGQVFRARHEASHNVVALKLIRRSTRSHGAPAGGLSSLKREIHAVLELNHPNIVRALDVNETDGACYYTMELIRGTDLARLVQEQGPLPVAEAIELMRQAAQGLQHAHERGLVHRDIKPANLMVTEADAPQGLGRVKILDFGLARLLAQVQADRKSQAGKIVGTPNYLAPEQVLNQPVDIRSDLYSLGCTLFFLLTGQPPFRGNFPMDVVIKHCREEPPPLTQFRQDVPAGLQAIVSKLLAKRPEDRYQTPAELIQALSAPAGPATPAPTPGAPRALVKLSTSSQRVLGKSRPLGERRWPYVAAAMALLLGLAAWARLALPPFHSPPGDANSLAAVQPAETPTPANPAPPVKKPESEPKLKPAASAKVEPESVTVPELMPPPRLKPTAHLDPKPAPKQPVPEPDRQATAQRLIREIYKDDYERKKPAEIQALADKLLKVGIDTRDDWVVRFVLLSEARDLAIQAGDMDTALAAIDQLEADYAIDALGMKIAALERASRLPLGSQGLRGVSDAALELAEDYMIRDQYEEAGRLFGIAESAAKVSKVAGLLPRIQNRLREFAEIREAYELARPAVEVLKTQPGDPEANLRWGRFLCFYKGNWGEGLGFLALGADDRLKLLASRELTQPEEAAVQLDLGDGWWDLAQQEKGVPRKELLLRAKIWYDQAVRQLTGFSKTKVEKRLAEILKIVTAEPPGPAATTPTGLPPNRIEFNKRMAAAQYAYRQGRYADAIKSINQALTLFPDDPRAQAALRDATAAQERLNNLLQMLRNPPPRGGKGKQQP
jgi:serine/threonine-protein kinase